MKNNKKLYSIALASIAMILMLVSIAGAAPYAYVPNSGDGTVSVIDTSTNTVTATVHVGSYPTGVSVNPAGKTVYVTNTLSDTVSVIDTSTHNVTSTVAVGSSPVGVSVNPAGTMVYVANCDDDTVSVIDTSTNTVTSTVPVGNDPSGVSFNPAGTKVYVANYEDENVYVIDTSTNTVTSTVSVGSGPAGVSVNPSGTMVYVANCDDDTVSVIDTSTNTVTSTVVVGSSPNGVSFNPAGTKVYVANYDDDTVSVIDTSTNTVTSTVPVGSGPFGISVNPAGTMVYVVNTDDGTVSVIDTSTNTVTATVPVGKGPFAFGQFIMPEPVFPVASFSSNVSSGYAPLSVQFNDSSANATEVNWDFDNNGVADSTERNPVYQYVNAGYYTINLTASNGYGTNSTFATITVLEQNPAYTIDKTVTNVAGKGPSGTVTKAGDVISYQVNVTNDGNIDLTNVSVTDPLLGTLTGPTGDNSPTGTLNVGEIWTYTGNYTVTQEDINSNGGGDGFINNTATVDCDELDPENDSVAVLIKSSHNGGSGGTGSARIIPKYAENVEVNKNVTEIRPVENTGDVEEHTGNEVAGVEQETEPEESKSAPGFEMICGIVGLLGTFLYRRR